MILLAVAAVALILAAIPSGLFLLNLRHYREPAPAPDGSKPGVSVLIPARNEEANIREAVEHALASEGVDLEVIVLDDHSEDATWQIVSELAKSDGRLRGERAPDLPPGWCGKQHACWVLAGLARHDVLAFVDADVHLGPEAVSRAVSFMESSGAELVSGFPREITGSLGEKLLIPLIQFILLGFLPIARMRRSLSPAFAAGCGQFIVTRRDSYRQVDGHRSIRASRHDGIALPRTFRRAGLMTDLFDATELASCHMYGGFGEVWSGLAKNAREGLGSNATILPFTAILLGGQVLPFVLLAWALAAGAGSRVTGIAALAAGLALLPRLIAARRFGQSLLGSLLHPLGVAVLVSIQWHALVSQLLGRGAEWKGRRY
jgi:glycosyltransferase involved in cell wall biosynthesis